ncbi:MAG: MoaD/ThiS family protein [Acidobacteria bacterium]|nr:MoaD/ThiS family protein [Acidobacteriota bacterium]
MIRVLAFARYRELLGHSDLQLPLPDPPTLEALLSEPRLRPLPGEALLAVNQRYARRNQVLQDGDEVALLPPVSGG